MDFKKIFRWLGVTIMGYALIMSLFLIANATVFNVVTSNRERMESIISDSGIYHNISSTLFDNVKASDTSELANPDVKKAAFEVFDTEFFQTSVESGLNGAYDWLNGQTETPTFSIDLSKPREQFINKSVEYRIASIETLPVCTAKQLQTDLNIFTLNCKTPFTLDSALLKQQVRDELDKSEEFLSKDTFSPQDLKNDDGKAFYDELPNLPEKFQAAKKLPYILIVFVGLLGAGIIYASESKKRGLLSLSRTFIVSGIFILFAPSGINFLSDKILSATNNDDATKNIVQPLLNEFNSATAYIYYWTGAIVVLLGVVGLLVYADKIKLTKRLKK